MKTNYFIVKSEISKGIDLETGWIENDFVENDFRKAMIENGYLNLKTLRVYKCKNKKEYKKIKNN
jgi:hypothetical protein